VSQPHPDSAVLEPRSTSEPRRVLGISGSLRRDSYNRLLLRAAAQVAPTTVGFVAWDGLKAVPPFDEDEAAPPPPVVSLREAIAGVDALLIATPEYNASLPASAQERPRLGVSSYETSVLRGKVVRRNTARARVHRARCAHRPKSGPCSPRPVLTCLDVELAIPVALSSSTSKGYSLPPTVTP